MSGDGGDPERLPRGAPDNDCEDAAGAPFHDPGYLVANG